MDLKIRQAAMRLKRERTRAAARRLVDLALRAFPWIADQTHSWFREKPPRPILSSNYRGVFVTSALWNGKKSWLVSLESRLVYWIFPA